MTMKKSFYLSLNLSIDPFSFCISTDQTVLFEKKIHGDYSFTENIIYDIENACKSNHLSLTDCKAISVVNGPGSYTGTRIAISTVNTLAQVLHCPIIDFDSLDSISESCKPFNDFLIIAIHSRKNEITFALFSSAGKAFRMSHNQAVSTEQFLSFLKKFNHPITLAGPLNAQFLKDCSAITTVSALYKSIDTSVLTPISFSPKQDSSSLYLKPTYLHNAV